MLVGKTVVSNLQPLMPTDSGYQKLDVYHIKRATEKAVLLTFLLDADDEDGVQAWFPKAVLRGHAGEVHVQKGFLATKLREIEEGVVSDRVPVARAKDDFSTAKPSNPGREELRRAAGWGSW